jgi:ribose/xylose/arabinose/galactoside ABC-type transport system permease subunit
VNADVSTLKSFATDRLGRLRGLELQEYALAVVVVALFVAGAIAKPDTFPTWDNIRNMLTQASVVGVLAIGMTFVIATAGIDLSVGSMVAAAGVFGGILVDASPNSLVFILGALAFARPSPTAASSRSSRRWPCSRSLAGSRCC